MTLAPTRGVDCQDWSSLNLNPIGCTLGAVTGMECEQEVGPVV